MSAASQVEFSSDLAESLAAQPAAQPAVGRYHWKSYLSAAAPARALEAVPEAHTEEESTNPQGFSTAPNIIPSSPQTPTLHCPTPQNMESSAAPAIGSSTREDAELPHLRNEVSRLHALIAPSAPPRGSVEMTQDGSARLRLKRELESRGLDRALAERLLTSDDAGTDGSASYAQLREDLENRLSSLWTTDPCIGRPGSSPRIAALVGPAGCGKTSALVKLAIRYGLGQRWALHLISVDQIRVGAMEPLEAYAALLAAPLSAVDEPDLLGEELQRVCCGETRPDLVLIDTPGYAPAERERASAMAEAFRAFDAIDVHLVLPGGLSSDDLRETAARFDAFEADKLLFTKLDETGAPGALLAEHLRSSRPVSFLSRGHRVPEDLAPAGGIALTRLVLGERPV